MSEGVSDPRGLCVGGGGLVAKRFVFWEGERTRECSVSGGDQCGFLLKSHSPPSLGRSGFGVLGFLGVLGIGILGGEGLGAGCQVAF